MARGLVVKIKVSDASGLCSFLYGKRSSKLLSVENDWSTHLVTARTANKLLAQYPSEYVQLVK